MPEPIVEEVAIPEAKAEEVVESVKDETDWKAESRKWETRAKENSTAAAQLAAIEEEKKTAEERLEERATKAEKDLADALLERARAVVALDKGLTASQAKRLVGSTPEELAADADELLADLGKQSTAPKADLSQGPKATGGSQDPAQQFAEIIRNARG